MWRLLIISAAAQIVHCYCPGGLDLVRDGECRGSYANMSFMVDNAMDTVVAKCKEIQAQPIIIHNEEHQSYWQEHGYIYPPKAFDPMLIPCLVCNSTSTKWQWVDGSPMDYKPEHYHSYIDQPCRTRCAFFMQSDGTWWPWTDKNAYTVDISCTAQLTNPPITDDCDLFEDDSEDGVCYQVGDTAESWKDAQLICKKLGANLASIHNQQENSFVRRLAVSRGAVTGLYLGATVTGKGGDYGWIDGSAWDYDNFVPGFPKPVFGECIGMDTASTTGQWKNIECTEKLPVACIRQHKVDPVPSCSTETWKEGAIITSPGFPHSASTPCDYYLMVDVGKKVEVEIAFVEANSCCDHLIIYDGYFGSALANMTGEINNATFTTTSSHVMQVSWQPNGGVNVLGFAVDLAHSSCPSGFEIVNAECRGKYDQLKLSWVDAPKTAIDMCEEILGQPVIIHNSEDDSYWRNKKVASVDLVIGLLCNTTTKKWVWADGSALDYKTPVHDPALDKDCTPGFTWGIFNDGSGWGGSGNNPVVVPVDFYCTTPLRQPSGDGCDGFEDDYEDGVCYQVGTTAESWQDAQMICKKLGANLASIHNAQENSFIRRLAVSKGAVNGLFLGATTSGKGNDFGWVDGTAWDYENFYPGFPLPGIGNCIAMDTTNSAGQWMNIDCSTKLPVACVRNQKNITEPTCGAGFSNEGIILTSPGFPYSAYTPCDYFLEVDEGKSVEVEISLEANPCCDFLVLHDGFLGGNMIANLTGELRNVTYTSASNLMRVSWQPDGGVNVRGLAMTYRGV